MGPLVALAGGRVAAALGTILTTRFLWDIQPVPVVGYQRSKKHSDFAGSASYGVCVSRNLKCFGYKLVLRSTREGLPVAYELVPVHTDERAAADTVLSVLWHGDVVGDKGFLGADGPPHLDAHASQSTSTALRGSTASTSAWKAPSTKCRTPDAT